MKTIKIINDEASNPIAVEWKIRLNNGDKSEEIIRKINNGFNKTSFIELNLGIEIVLGMEIVLGIKIFIILTD